jgi:hypothetical protein
LLRDAALAPDSLWTQVRIRVRTKIKIGAMVRVKVEVTKVFASS